MNDNTTDINGVIIFRETYEQFKLMSMWERGECVTLLLNQILEPDAPIDSSEFSAIARAIAITAISSAKQSRRKYANNAEKQRAYRKRKNEKSVTECYGNVTDVTNGVTDVTPLKLKLNSEIEIDNKEITPNGVKESKPKKIDYLANCKNRSDEYDAIMLEWLEYKKERKDKLTTLGVSKTYAKLIRLSDGIADKAKAIIEDAIANGYQGFFQLKENKGGGAPQRTRPISEIRGGGWVDTEFSNSWD